MKIKKKIITIEGGDIHTPVGLYLKLRDVFDKSLLLESSDYHTKSDSYSYICCSPFSGISIYQNSVEEYTYDDLSSFEFTAKKEGYDAFASFISKHDLPEDELGLGIMESGYFGFTSYEAVQFFEDIELNNKTEDIPLIHYNLYQFQIIFNHFKDELYIQYQDEESVFDEERLSDFISIINYQAVPKFNFKCVGKETVSETDDKFLETIAKCKQHAYRGDIFQIVPSRVFEQSFEGDEFQVYRKLRSLNPSPYLFYFDFGSYKVFGSSPEAQLTIKENKATLNPIAGTYKRTGNDEKDTELAQLLLNDSKEIAEHTMLVDLARNDLNKASNSVKLDSFKEIQFYSHVIHMVSKVSATVGSGSSLNLYGATFPAGTLSGAPKYRAMQLIDTYETKARGFYGGGIGMMNGKGYLNHAIIIRSFVSKNNKLRYQAGCGIVALSDDKSELQEVNNKLEALRNALVLAQTK